MQHKIETQTFFFDAKTDYLPHFRKHQFKIDGAKRIVDILDEVAQKERIFQYPKEEPLLRINGVWLSGELSVEEAVSVVGNEWKIEPISPRRAVKDLIIDDSDFIQKHEVLAEFASEEDFVYYKTLKNIYYASGSLPYNEDYFGDSMFVYAHYLIGKYPEKKAQIMEVISDKNGIWLYEEECNRYPLDDSDAKIKSLLKELPSVPVEGYTNELMAYYDKAESALCEKFGVQKDEDCALETIVDNITLDRVKEALKHPFSDFQVAFYAGSFACENIDEVQQSAKEVLETIGAKVVDFTRSTYADGFDIVDTDPEVAFKKAGNILLDAFDSGAEILVVDNAESHFMMDQNILACEKAVGRDIRMPVLNIAQMVALAVGITDEAKIGLDAHKIVPEFV